MIAIDGLADRVPSIFVPKNIDNNVAIRPGLNYQHLSASKSYERLELNRHSFGYTPFIITRRAGPQI